MSARHLILVALKFAPVHRLHALAYREAFLQSCRTATVTWIVADEYRSHLPPEDRVVTVGSGLRHSATDGQKSLGSVILRRLQLAKDLSGFVLQCIAIRKLQAVDVFENPPSDGHVHVLFQTTHPANAGLMTRLRRLFRHASLGYYLHEPTSWFAKLRKREGMPYATAVYMTQWRDLRNVDFYYVAHRRALISAATAYPIRGLLQRGRILPLPFRDMYPDFASARRLDGCPLQVLMLGRADDTRCLDIFLAAAAESARRKLEWRFVVLSGRTPPIPQWAKDIRNLELRTGQPYTDEEMAAELCRSRFVFNVYRVAYMQSGVSPVAFMFGVPVIAHTQEYVPELQAAGCLYFDAVPTAAEVVDRLCSAPDPDPDRLRQFYLRTFDARHVRVFGVDRAA
jgi:hypothetical protein